MLRLKRGDVNEIIELLENEISVVRKIDRIEKMRFKTKIRKQRNWLLAFRNPKPEKVFEKLKEKLSDVFTHYPICFSDQLKDLLSAKLR